MKTSGADTADGAKTADPNDCARIAGAHGVGGQTAGEPKDKGVRVIDASAVRGGGAVVVID